MEFENWLFFSWLLSRLFSSFFSSTFALAQCLTISKACVKVSNVGCIVRKNIFNLRNELSISTYTSTVVAKAAFVFSVTNPSPEYLIERIKTLQCVITMTMNSLPGKRLLLHIVMLINFSIHKDSIKVLILSFDDAIAEGQELRWQHNFGLLFCKFLFTQKCLRFSYLSC